MNSVLLKTSGFYFTDFLYFCLFPISFLLIDTLFWKLKKKQKNISNSKRNFAYIYLRFGIMYYYAVTIAAITNYHTFSSIKEQEFIFLLFWRQEAGTKCLGMKLSTEPGALRKN